MHELLDPMKNPVTYAVPFFLLTILIELAALKWLDDDHDEAGKPRTGYLGPDARTSMSMGAISLLFSLALKVGSFLVYNAVFVYITPESFKLPTDTWWYWVLLILAVDFTFYLSHRFVHRVNVG